MKTIVYVGLETEADRRRDAGRLAQNRKAGTNQAAPRSRLEDALKVIRSRSVSLPLEMSSGSSAGASPKIPSEAT